MKRGLSKLILGALLVFAATSGTIMFFSIFSRESMLEMPENDVIKEIVYSYISTAESLPELKDIRLIPERSRHGRYLTGKFKGYRHGRFTYDLWYELGNHDILEVEWRSSKNGPAEDLVITDYGIENR